MQFEQRMREDEFLSAHLHGLWIAGADAERTAAERCKRDSPADHFVRAWARWASQGTETRVLVEALQECGDDRALLDATCETLRWLPPLTNMAEVATSALPATSDSGAAAVLRLCGRQRWPVGAASLERALAAQSNQLREAAFTYCSCLGQSQYLAQVIDEVRARPEADVTSLVAARAGLRFGDRQIAVGRLWQAAVSPPAPDADTEALLRDSLLDLCVAIPLADSRAAWESAKANGAPVNRLLAAAEASNDPQHLPWLTECFGDPVLREDAAAALTWLLGEVTDADDGIHNFAATDEIRAWLQTRSWPHLEHRWIGGQAIRKESVFATLLHGPLRFRHHAARHLALVAPTTPDLDVDAPAFTQLQWLFEVESALDGDAHD